MYRPRDRRKTSYHYNTWKWLKMAIKKWNKEHKRVLLGKLVSDIKLVYERCTSLWLECNRWKFLKYDKDFEENIRLRMQNESNPIVKKINDKLWVNGLYTSLYRHRKWELESWAVMSYKADIYYYNYVVLNNSAVNYNEAKIIYWYPSSIKKEIVKWNFKIVEKAIDLFCETIKKEE